LTPRRIFPKPYPMNLLMQLTPAQLRKAADIQEQIQGLQTELAHILGTEAVPSASSVEAPATAKEPKKRFSVRTRAKMAAAQKARWAAKRGEVARPAEVESKATPATQKSAKQTEMKKGVSEAKLKALAKARAARWAKVRTAKSTADKSVQEKPKKKRKMSAAWRRALERAWAARRAKAAGKA